MLRTIGKNYIRLLSRSTKPFSTTTSKTDYDLTVIGGGPGGYVAAIKAAQLGLKVACVEKRDTLGGTCLNVGCIPSKALLNSTHYYHIAKNDLGKFGITKISEKAKKGPRNYLNSKKASDVKIDVGKMMSSKLKNVNTLTKGIEMLFRKNKVDWLKGEAKLRGPHEISYVKQGEEPKSIISKNIVLATGSQYRDLPGVKIDEKNVVSSTGALEFDKIPEHLVVVGAGVIGLEMGSVWRRLGSKVTVVEFLDRIAPSLDGEIASEFTKILKRQGFEFHFGTGVHSAERKGEKIYLELKSSKGEKKSQLVCDKVLVAVGRKPYFDGLGVEETGIKTEKGLIKVDSELRTNVNSIFAIGDIVRGPQLAHKAEEEGVAVAELIAGKTTYLNYDAIPSVIYTNPEVGCVGKTEEELKEEKVKYNKGKFPFLANSRAKAVDDYEGFVKILADKSTDKILGAHIIGEQAGDLIQECCLAVNYGGSSEDIARTCHAHPTRSEALKEAALATFDKSIHF